MRALCLLAALSLSACGGLPQNVVVLLPDDGGQVGHVVVASSAGQPVELSNALQAVQTDKPSQPFVAKQADVDKAFAGALSATPRAAIAYTIYFLTGKSDPDPKSSADLSAAIEKAKSLANLDITVAGHADATGGEEENRVLSIRRAETVRDLLVAGGVPTEVIKVSYFGSNVPAVPTPPGISEPLNRRVVITIR